jgi:hypothetical protein
MKLSLLHPCGPARRRPGPGPAGPARRPFHRKLGWRPGRRRDARRGHRTPRRCLRDVRHERGRSARCRGIRALRRDPCPRHGKQRRTRPGAMMQASEGMTLPTAAGSATCPNRRCWRSPSPPRRTTPASTAAMPSGCAPTTPTAPSHVRRDGGRGGRPPPAPDRAAPRRFGEVIPLIRREHVAGYYARRPVWLVENLGLDRIRAEAERWSRTPKLLPQGRASAPRTPPPASCWAISPRAEAGHRASAGAAEAKHLDADARETEDRARIGSSC